ncbi:MAG: hypothetical protein ACI4ES_12225 [Roseburia sp.]
MSCSKKCPYTDKHCIHSLPICMAYEKEYKPLTAIRCKIEVSHKARENSNHTNADRIRSMSDEELAEWLTKITDDAQLDAATKCNYQWEEWLKSEVEQ